MQNEQTETPTYEQALEAARAHIDSHIRQWRENHNHPDAVLRHRAIDATDALQQLRKSLFGELLPQDDGTYKVFTHDGDQAVAGLPTQDRAQEVYDTAPVSERRTLEDSGVGFFGEYR
ncbi:MAG: hypothetical protein KGL39_18890 [Patescibacteria group bacterium]|nr:hypothetical protein [Patescibacteria group bacterium]